ncbi:PBP1A family penicillin-binding protein [Candidatus Shapirobacteria bacterium]|jgi:1A family penicillin-binding protein|nr:PBP1A family penicillin-binding protein [Candidatus Shapirobacteria bacterium]
MMIAESVIKFLIKLGQPLVEIVKFLTLGIKKIILWIKTFQIKSLRINLKTKSIRLRQPKIKFKPKLKTKERQRKETKPKKIKKIRWGKILAMGVIVSGVVIIGWWGWINIFKDLPNVNLIYNPPKLSTIITDRNGRVLYKFYEGENRTWVPLEKMPKDLIEATLAIEDKKFYKHHGLSFKGLIVAIRYNLKKETSDKPRGGSTITQQLVKNVFLGNEKTLLRKIKEVILTLMVEQKLSKDEILERYLNQVSYGGEAYGAEAAAQKYFGKSVTRINTIEAAYLAGLPAAPSSYSPYGNNPELGLLRAKKVIEEMVANKYLTEVQAEKWLSKKINIKNNNKQILAPHFVFYIKNLMEEKYGFTNIERRGLIIKTTLDLEIQKMVDKIISQEINSIAKLNVSNGAAVVVGVREGEILAMAGSKDYQAKDIDGKYNVTTALRQPGSSIKPINYLLALENGYSMASRIEDTPVTYQIKGQKPYSPQNYNGKYMGSVSLRTALGSSLNIPSVKLLEKNGVEKMIDLGEKMGINSWKDRKRFGLSLALGSGEVKMTEMAQAYSIFANLGEKIEINPILEIDNYLGEKIYIKEIEKERVTKAEYAYIINDVLSDNQARTPIFGANSKLIINGKTVAVKTGTTNNLKDNWCIGWTPTYLVATWVGNNDSRPMSWVASGVTGATPIWNKIMTNLLEEKENEIWEVPEGLVKKRICGKEEWMIEGSEIKVNCPMVTPTPIN